MKQFMLAATSSNFNEVDRTYSIWLGNRSGLKFNSKRNMCAFVADTNRFLTAQMVELNIFYKMVFCEYRDTWFLLYNIKNGKKVNRHDIEREIETALKDVQDQFSRAGGSYMGSSSGGWSFKFLENICYFLITATDLLIQINKDRNNTINYHNLRVIKGHIGQVNDKIFKYPEKTPAGCIEVLRN